ncbi:MAG: hypothetical protein OEZ36_01630 [Spirochaetota bacterium]|nr:hypothetical protein [Spirochaetota bacterium]
MTFDELDMAQLYANAAGYGDYGAFINRASGEIIYYYEDEEFNDLPDDLDDGEKYLAVPNDYELDLVKSMVFRFVRAFIPDEEDQVYHIFRKQGAYGRFKNFLIIPMVFRIVVIILVPHRLWRQDL